MARIKRSPNRPKIPSSGYCGIWEENLDIELDVMNLEGFVYEVENRVSGKKYIGRKSFWSRPKGEKKPSNWKTYTTSSREVNELLDKGVKFYFRILILCKTRESLIQNETDLQNTLNVLHARDESGEKLFYNGVIGGTAFVSINNEPFSEGRRKRVGANRDYSKSATGTKAQKRAQEVNKHRRWFNDGVKEFFLLPQDADEVLYSGRLNTVFNKCKDFRVDRICMTCGVVFKGKRQQKYCNTSCRPLSGYVKVPWVKIECLCCKKEFLPKKHNNKFCCSTCKYTFKGIRDVVKLLSKEDIIQYALDKHNIELQPLEDKEELILLYVVSRLGIK